MLTDEQVRNGLINTAYRWPNKTVPFVIDDVFSKYCSIQLQSTMWDLEGKIMHYEYCFSCSTHWRLSGGNNGDSYLYLLVKTIINTHTHTHINSAI